MGRATIKVSTAMKNILSSHMIALSNIAILSVSLSGLALNAAAQETTAEPVTLPTTIVQIPQNFCPDGQIVIVDNTPQCRLADTLETLIKDFEAYTVSSDPIRAGEEGDVNALRKLPDVTKDTVDLAAAQTTEFLARHAALSTTAMTEAQRLNYDLLGFTLKQQHRLNPFDTARIPFTNDSGFFNSLSYISRQTQFRNTSDYEAYAARLTQLPRFFSQHKENMRRGIETEFTASAEILPGIIETISSLASGKPNEHALFAPFKKFPNSVDAQEQKRLTALGEAAIK